MLYTVPQKYASFFLTLCFILSHRNMLLFFLTLCVLYWPTEACFLFFLTLCVLYCPIEVCFFLFFLTLCFILSYRSMLVSFLFNPLCLSCSIEVCFFLFFLTLCVLWPRHTDYCLRISKQCSPPHHTSLKSKQQKRQNDFCLFQPQTQETANGQPLSFALITLTNSKWMTSVFSINYTDEQQMDNLCLLH